MTQLSYDRRSLPSCLLVIDQYNDFISQGGLPPGRPQGDAEANNCIPYMRQVPGASHVAGLHVFYALHHR